MDSFLGSIILFAGPFAPEGWAFCDGSLLSIQQNTALFSLLGTTYGGDGKTTFGLPDLRGRVPLHVGRDMNGYTLTQQHTLGEKGGAETVTLNARQLPPHTHTLSRSADGPNGEFTGASLAAGDFYADAPANMMLNSGSIGMTGNGEAHSNMQPYLGLNFIICLQGIYPMRP